MNPPSTVVSASIINRGNSVNGFNLLLRERATLDITKFLKHQGKQIFAPYGSARLKEPGTNNYICT